MTPSSAAHSTLLDLRPIFQRGDTPCETINQATAATAVGHTLVLLAPFEPVPLYAKFGKRGFTHETSQLPDGTWQVALHRVAPEPAEAPESCGCSH